MNLTEKILHKLGAIKELHALQAEEENIHRVPPLFFWQQVSSTVKTQAKKVKNIVGDQKVSSIDKLIIESLMNHLSEVNDHAERQIIIHGTGRIKN